MLIRTLILLVIFPCSVFAQNWSSSDYFIMWEQTDCQVHALRRIIEREGNLADSCPPMLSKNEKDIYIIREPYFKNMPDSFKGYRVHYINTDSNTKYWYDKQQKDKIHIYYFSPVFNYVDYHYLFIMPVVMKKRKTDFSTNAYKCYYYFHQDRVQYEFSRAACVDWEADDRSSTDMIDFR